jgi:hypothetical protein
MFKSLFSRKKKTPTPREMRMMQTMKSGQCNAAKRAVRANIELKRPPRAQYVSLLKLCNSENKNARNLAIGFVRRSATTTDLNFMRKESRKISTVLNARRRMVSYVQRVHPPWEEEFLRNAMRNIEHIAYIDAAVKRSVVNGDLGTAFQRNTRGIKLSDNFNAYLTNDAAVISRLRQLKFNSTLARLGRIQTPEITRLISAVRARKNAYDPKTDRGGQKLKVLTNNEDQLVKKVRMNRDFQRAFDVDGLNKVTKKYIDKDVFRNDVWKARNARSVQLNPGPKKTPAQKTTSWRNYMPRSSFLTRI